MLEEPLIHMLTTTPLQSLLHNHSHSRNRSHSLSRNLTPVLAQNSELLPNQRGRERTRGQQILVLIPTVLRLLVPQREAGKEQEKRLGRKRRIAEGWKKYGRGGKRRRKRK